MKPTLDIITVTKDDPEGVAATILSTRKLRACPGVRQIIVDSSSEPASAKIKELLLGEQCVDYLWQEPGGISAAFNLGVSTAKADWVWFLNGRDEAHPELNADFFMQTLDSSKAGIVIFQLEFMQSGIVLQRPPLWGLWPPLYWVPHPATLIRTQLFREYGTFDESFKIAMDGDMWMRFFSKDVGVDMLSIPVVLYDQHGVSSTNLVDTRKEAARIVNNNFELLVKTWVGRGTYLLSLSKECSPQNLAAHSSCQSQPCSIGQADPASFELYKLCLDELAICKHELENNRNELEALKSQHNLLLQSRSWKLTKPLRMATGLFKRTGGES